MTPKALPDFKSGAPKHERLTNKALLSTQHPVIASGAPTQPDSTLSDARLAALIDAWTDLPEPVRTGIAAMVLRRTITPLTAYASL